MNNIEIHIINPETIKEAEKMMVCSARLTQCGHKIHNMQDFINLYEKDYTEETVRNMVSLPHPTIQKFGVINIVIVGASRRFLSQITRHQNEVKFMSASLQYSDYSGVSDFVVPYEVLKQGEAAEKRYLETCKKAMQEYSFFIEQGVDNDSAGYMAPQSLRNVLIISATPYQWKHMIAQRTCRRNTTETRFVMLRIWEQLYNVNPFIFEKAGPPCLYNSCPEGKMSCGTKILAINNTPIECINADFSLL